jgi:uncharacterized protein YrrD
MPVESTDGVVGELAAVVIDPVRRRVTHIVVESSGHHDRARLIAMVAVVNCGDRVTLSWPTVRVSQAPHVEDTEFLEFGHRLLSNDEGDVGIVRVLGFPFYGSGPLDNGMGVNPGWTGSLVARVDRLPPGTAEIRRASRVVSSDDHVVGRVDGFVIDPVNGISNVILERGHLWGHREITIPIRQVASVVSDEIHLRASREEIGRFPSVPFHRSADHGSKETRG